MHMISTCLRFYIPSAFSSFVARLKIVNGLEDRINRNGRGNVADNIFHIFVCHRTFVKCAAVNGGGINTVHLFFELRYREGLFGGASAHQATGPMRSREVPVPISLSGTKQTAVTHIDGDQQFLSALGRHRPLPQDHVFRVNIVVNGRELLYNMKLHSFYDNIHHSSAVKVGIPLSDLHVI